MDYEKIFKEARQKVLANPPPELRKAREELEYAKVVLAVFEGKIKVGGN